MIDSITNIENYNSSIEETFVDINNKLKELFNEYVNHFHENFQNNYTEYNKFVFIKGFQTISNVFYMLLLYLKNLDVAFLNSKQSIFYYIEFIGQIGNDSNSFLQLNSKDATLFVYKKTIYDINNIYRKNFTLDDKEQQFLNSISNIIMLFNATLFHLLQKERLKYEKKESIIHFAVDKSASIIDKLFNSGNYTLIDSKTELCLFVFQNFQTFEIDTIKYSNICEIFVKKLRKYLDEKTLGIMKTRIKEKINDNKSIKNLSEMSALRYINWLLHPL